ncbi:MAG: Ig-like domain-containing protein, partial [Longimicrobiales bacterium]
MIARNARRWARLSVVSAVLALCIVPACEDATAPDADGIARLRLHADLAGTAARALVVEVTAKDIPQPVNFEVRAEGGIAAGTVALPIGQARTVTIRAVNADGLATHVGAATIDVLGRTEDMATIVLTSQGGATPPIHANLGIFVVTVTPEVSQLRIGETAQLTAHVTDIDGKPVNGNVDWATTHRQIVAVDKDGFIQAVAPGMATITAEFKGTAGLARVFVAEEKPEFFVSALTGDDANAGTRAAPFATIQRAIDAAGATGSGGEVYVAGGSYAESLTLRTGVSIRGGYDPETWFRGVEDFPTNVFGGTTAVSGTNVQSLTLDGLNIWSADAASNGASSVGIRLVDSRDVVLSHDHIFAGNGADGVFGAPGGVGANGRPGRPGKDGQIGTISKIDPPCGGEGGLHGNGQPSGGAGGDGGPGLFSFNLVCPRRTQAGEAGHESNGGPGGVGAFVLSGADGQGGTEGRDGSIGIDGAGGTAFGAFVASAYVPADGTGGQSGANGGGGGGGGGGSATITNTGGGGGGGGGGGVAGTAGGGGLGGGGSFGVILENSTGIELRANHIVTGRGG